MTTFVGRNLFKIDDRQVVVRIFHYEYVENVRDDEENAELDKYVAYLREHHDNEFADAVETMRKAGAKGGLFENCVGVVGFLDGYDALIEMDGADYDGQTFAKNYFRGIAPSVGFGLCTKVRG